MCGIGLIIAPVAHADAARAGLPALQAALQRRGPDAVRVHEWRTETAYIAMVGAVLHMRGARPVPQPLLTADGSALLWNGEVFGGLEVTEAVGDTVAVADWLWLGELPAGAHDRMLSRFAAVRGPWATIAFDAKDDAWWFGRDAVGRRSLLMRQPSEGFPLFIVSSVAHPGAPVDGWEEVPTTGLFRATLLATEHETEWITVSHHPWPSSARRCRRTQWGLPPPACPAPDTAPAAIAIPAMDAATGPVIGGAAASTDASHRGAAAAIDVPQLAEEQLEPARAALLAALDAAVCCRVASIPEPVMPDDGSSVAAAARVAVLFSGGLDSTVVAALAHRHVPEEEPIDLINVCFDPDQRSPDRHTAVLAAYELAHLYPRRPWRLVCVNASFDAMLAQQAHLLALLRPKVTHMDVNIAAALWFAAQGRGTVFRPGDRRPLPVPVAAALGHADSPPSTPLPQSAPGCAHSVKSDCKWRRCRSCCLRHQSELLEAAGPVSQAALAALADTPDAPLPEPVLRALCMAHKPKQYRRALSRMRAFENRTARDVHGADARDLEECGRTDLPAYVTRARVLLSGLGADEQMAGYGRHRTRFRVGGWDRLNQELAEDTARLWTRNLGRDDRCLSDHGREARYPFLDEGVMDLLSSLPLHMVADLRLPAGVGDKRLLRLVARSLMLQVPAALPKRAIQFGTRIAQQTNVRVLGAHRRGDGAHRFVVAAAGEEEAGVLE